MQEKTLSAVKEKAEMQKKMWSVKTREIETLRKELSSCRDKLLQYETKHAKKSLVQLG